jgi:DUF1707 SHOCT-like domain
VSEIRASDQERERTVEALRRHAAAGRIDSAELEERLGLALAAKTKGDLAQIVEDLPAERPRPASAPVRHHRGACGSYGKSPQGMLAIAVLLVAIWAVTGAGYFWPMWPLAYFAVAGFVRMRGGNTGVIRYQGVNRYHTSHR